MGKIFYIIGKSATGKDTILAELLGDRELKLQEIIQYTTRPMRAGEEEGREYHFISDEKAEAFSAQGKVIEMRAYNTVHGVWKYMLVDDGSIDLDHHYVAVGTVESYKQASRFFGEGVVIPIYIQVETGERLQRALNRERKQAVPKYSELCRRFLADEADFSMDNLADAGLVKDGEIVNCFENVEIGQCIARVKAFIGSRI